MVKEFFPMMIKNLQKPEKQNMSSTMTNFNNQKNVKTLLMHTLDNIPLVIEEGILQDLAQTNFN